MAKRRLLSKTESDAAAKLDLLWERQKHSPQKMSLESAADHMEWSNGSAVRAYLKGHIPLNASALIKFSRLFSVPPADIFPEMANEMGLDKAIDDQLNAGLPSEAYGRLNFQAADFAVQGILTYSKEFPDAMSEEFRIKAFKSLYKAWFIQEMKDVGAMPLLSLID